jgi:hypothetical protein
LQRAMGVAVKQVGIRTWRIFEVELVCVGPGPGDVMSLRPPDFA